MTLREYLDNLNKAVNEHPEYLELEVITSKDDEGNGYNVVYYGPTVGEYNKEDKEFREEVKINSICVN